MTDVILSEYRERAEKSGITFESRFVYPENENLDVFDVSVILNNALENALQAAKKFRENHGHSYINLCS